MTSGVVFAGGGTGGHVFPALAIAEQLAAGATPPRMLFLCSTRPLDAEILRREQVAGEAATFSPVPAQPFGVRPRALWKFVSTWGSAVAASRQMLRDLRATCPRVVVVAMGGFVAAPVAQAARAEKLPILLINLDAVPGKANRWISRHATRVLTAARVHGGAPGWSEIPPIVRAGAAWSGTRADARAELALDPERPTLMVTGGSQGAGSINQLMALLAGRGDLAGWQVIHQAGKDEAEVAAAYAKAGVPACVRAFFRPMSPCWGAADVAVSRAGAGSVAEAWANRVPTVFLPYPYHRDQHQAFNARVLVDAGAAVCPTDHVDSNSNAADAGEVIRALVSDAARRGAMRQALERLGPANGAAQAADAIRVLAT